MNIKEIVELMHEFDASGLTKMCVEEDNIRLKFSKQGKAACETVAAPADTAQVKTTAGDALSDAAATADNGATICSPLVGTFYAAAAPEAAPYVKEGDSVKKGAKLCLIEAMKMMNEVTAPYDCIIKKIHMEDGALVEYNSVLFDIEKA